MGWDEIGRDQQWKNLLWTNQHKHYYKSSAHPSLSALCGSLDCIYHSSIWEVGTEIIPQSTAAPPLSIFAAPFSLNSLQKCIHIKVCHPLPQLPNGMWSS